MKALSLWQPWASALFTPLKRYETRHWPAPSWLIGQRIAIHAAKKRDADVRDFWEGLDDREYTEFARIGVAVFDQLPFGALVGTAVLVKCHRTEALGIQHGCDDYEWGNHGPGRFAWEFAQHERFEQPVPYVGRQGIFNVETTRAFVDQGEPGPGI